ncbi:hypothetical protein CANINC_000883 [Pichia inconspicua]|uniref:Enoyl reductase (ER) domain-containing protein n=1 Tax=Pichia inconspicua TaxID=52247 RepID=A0A4T0X528_9ASCO|nr:hypothetical protein CANINC_000883 [[Candida] inconspicua]
MTTELPIKDNKLTIKAITYQSGYTPLTVKELEIPVVPETIVKPTEVLVEIKATSLNPVDCILKAFSKSWYGPKDKIIGGDFAGIVVKSGSESGFSEGDKIYGDLLSLSARGSFSNYALFEPKKCLIAEKIPEGLSFEHAASLPCVSNTAFAGLKQYQGDLSGKNVLILGAGTSVGYSAVQLAKYYFKAGNVVVTCSASSAERASAGGADVTIDYHKGDEFKKQQILDFVKSKGKFDVIFDAVRDESVFDYFDDIVAEGGFIGQVGGSYVLDYKNIRLYNLLPSWKILKNKLSSALKLTKYKVYPVWTTPDPEYGLAIEKLVKEKKLKVVIDSVYDAYTQANEAFDKVAACKAKGKVILRF